MDLPKTMSALVSLEDGFASDPSGQRLDTLEPYLCLDEVPVPVPGDHQALIKVSRAAVNPSDIAYIKGIYAMPRRKGVPAGLEGTGTVVAGDTPLVGQRVSFFGTGSGTWADYALSNVATLVPLRPDVSDDDAAGLIINPFTAMAMFDIVREDGAGSFLVTAGGSQLGKFLIGIGKDSGIGCIPVVRRAEQSGPLKALGATDVLVSTAPDFAERMTSVIAEHQPRVLLDAVGGQMSADLFSAMGKGGRWISYGRLDPVPPQLNKMQDFIFRDKSIEGFWINTWLHNTPPERVQAVVAELQARFADGRWKTEVLATVGLRDAMQRLPQAYGQADGKVLIAPDA